jgi:hypothetical protein
MRLLCWLACLLVCFLAADGAIFLGADKDRHGCLPSAGFSWCESKNRCIRAWEEPCRAVCGCICEWHTCNVLYECDLEEYLAIQCGQ